MQNKIKTFYVNKPFQTNNFITTITIAPGIPRIPIKIEVIKFNPIWKLKNEPIKFIKNITSPPSTEFNTNLRIVFIGTINTFPNINKKKIQAIYAIILLKSNVYHLSLINSMMLVSFYDINLNNFVFIIKI